jgi:hypothetical protein
VDSREKIRSMSLARNQNVHVSENKKIRQTLPAHYDQRVPGDLTQTTMRIKNPARNQQCDKQPEKKRDYSDAY